MKVSKITRIIGEIDEELISEAIEFRRNNKKKWKYIIVIAAGLSLVMALVGIKYDYLFELSESEHIIQYAGLADEIVVNEIQKGDIVINHKAMISKNVRDMPELQKSEIYNNFSTEIGISFDDLINGLLRGYVDDSIEGDINYIFCSKEGIIHDYVIEIRGKWGRLEIVACAFEQPISAIIVSNNSARGVKLNGVQVIAYEMDGKYFVFMNKGEKHFYLYTEDLRLEELKQIILYVAGVCMGK